MNPALVGLLGALPRLTDAITDPLMGFISDHTKSRWGRRRPYIFWGAIAAGLIWWRRYSNSSIFFPGSRESGSGEVLPIVNFLMTRHAGATCWIAPSQALTRSLRLL